MKKIFFVLITLCLVLCNVYADYIILERKLDDYSEEIVSSFNTLKGDVVVEAGSNVAITTNDNTLVISASSGEFTQVQSDWNVIDESSPAFIINKPTILTENDVYAIISNLVVNGGLVIDGVSYKLVVQPLTPPAWPAETTFKLSDGTVETNDISGNLDQQWMTDHEYYSSNSIIEANIGTNVTSIGEAAFSSCTNLTSVTIPDSVTSIGNSAFSGCSDLAGVTIPESVTSIGRYAFSGCDAMTSIIFEGKHTSEISTMTNYSWGIFNTSIIQGSLGD